MPEGFFENGTLFALVLAPLAQIKHFEYDEGYKWAKLNKNRWFGDHNSFPNELKFQLEANYL